jgi:glycosyltransferase involved in cell wall biosynthesis
LTIAYVGRLVGEKGLHLLLEAAWRLKSQGYQFRLKLVGDGPERRQLETLARRLDLDELVAFTGVLRGLELDAAIAEVEVLVMPSIYEETAGLAAMEQMMRGGAVIASEVGGLGEVVGSAGLKFAPGDVDGLVGALRLILDDRSVAMDLGRKARDRAVRVFSQKRMVDEHLLLYRELLCRAP